MEYSEMQMIFIVEKYRRKKAGRKMSQAIQNIVPRYFRFEFKHA
jgi:predicted acetyltransferase